MNWLWAQCASTAWGVVVTMLYGLTRSTADIDVLEIAPGSAGDRLARTAMQGGELHQKYIWTGSP
jgi:hypothetical protein